MRHKRRLTRWGPSADGSQGLAVLTRRGPHSTRRSGVVEPCSLDGWNTGAEVTGRCHAADSPPSKSRTSSTLLGKARAAGLRTSPSARTSPQRGAEQDLEPGQVECARTPQAWTTSPGSPLAGSWRTAGSSTSAGLSRNEPVHHVGCQLGQIHKPNVSTRAGREISYRCVKRSKPVGEQPIDGR